jgi:signal transduction histidine kinase
MVRTVEAAKEKVYQGFAVDWDMLSAHLIDVVSDLFDDVHFEVVESGEPLDPETTLASIPARLVTGPVSVASVGLWGGIDRPMAFAWIAALIALTAVGVGVRSLLSMSERRSQFAYAVTHELRTPLTTLCLYTDMLTDGLVPEAKRTEYIKALRDESQRLSGLVSGILEYSRVENQTVQPDRQDVPVADLVETLTERYGPRCDAAGLRLDIELNGLADARVNTDPQLAMQILGNLIDNACKYAANGSSAKVALHAANGRDVICFDVEDDGPGITRRDRRRVFRPFRRGRSDGTRKTGGVGLGLALAKSWARLLGGRLDLLPNAPAGGARFRLALPMGAPPVA